MRREKILEIEETYEKENIEQIENTTENQIVINEENISKYQFTIKSVDKLPGNINLWICEIKIAALYLIYIHI